MFWIRFRSSVMLMIITTASLLIGRELLFGILVLISLIGMTELYQVVGMKKSLPAMAGYVTCLIYDGLVYIKKDEYCFRLGIIFLLVLMFTYIICFPKYRSEQITMIYFGFYYVAVMLMFIYQVRMAKGGEYLVWLIFIGAWGSDTFAYLIGRKFGKYKIVPKLSPKKSAQGCIAGVFGAAFLGFLFALVFSNHMKEMKNPLLAFTIIGGCSSIISQMGDLAASAIKRNHEIKDYGTLIPGHGGVLDRFDSIIFTAPVVYFLSQILM